MSGEWKWSKVECLCAAASCWPVDAFKSGLHKLPASCRWGANELRLSACKYAADCFLFEHMTMHIWKSISLASQRVSQASSCFIDANTISMCLQALYNARSISSARSISFFFLCIIAFDIHFQHTWVCSCMYVYVCDSCQRLTQAFAYNSAINSIANSSLPHPFCAIYW